MSGFVGIVNLDGAPVESSLLEQLTRSMAFRGPDAEGVWLGEAIGLGHALLRTSLRAGSAASADAECDKQPANLDGRLWIVADARIDARAELIGKLKSKSAAASHISLSTPDALLILHAYDVWGDACVENLLGDFSFAIWDVRAKRLFCARDQFGVKPFFYAQAGSCLVFSNTLDCVRKHPAVSSRLNDLAIADFLLFDANQDVSTTSFAEIQRLAPAHTLTCERGTVSARRYSSLPVASPVHYARDEEYVEHFKELLDTAVADRLRSDDAGVLLSGGLDSSTVAASARRVVTRDGVRTQLSAYTHVYDTLIPHEERQYAQLVAETLQLPISFLAHDDCRLFEDARRDEYYSAEPINSALPDSFGNSLSDISARSRVLLTGDGSDPGFSSRLSVHFRQLLQTKQFGRALSDATRYFLVEGRASRLYLRTRWRLFFASKGQRSEFPRWLNEDFQRQHNLRERWESQTQTQVPQNAVRPEAHLAVQNSMWSMFFEGYDPGVTRAAVEIRHPFFDLRLMNFMLGLERLPWCSDKELLRQAGRETLPDAVRLRRKSPLKNDPLIALLKSPEAAWVDRFEPISELGKYVIRSRIPPVQGQSDTWNAWVQLRPLSLDFWLRGNDRYGKNGAA